MQNRHNKRARWHDYYARSIYLITINKRPDATPLGTLGGDWRVPPGGSNSPFIKLSDIGNHVRSMIKNLPAIIPNSQLMQYIVMPDHIHFLIFVKDRTPYHLGKYISKFKNAIRQEIGLSVFMTGFNDKILSVSRRLDDIFRYIKENPYRLAIKKANPDNFRRCDDIRIRGKRYTGYGNLFLLKNPFRDAVIIHRKYNTEERERLRELWIHNAYSGGVLVSPFISQQEKEIRNEAEKFGGRIILIVDKPLPPPPYKPAYRNFYRCAAGELLILAPYEETCEDKKLSRSKCLDLNNLAEYICSDRFNSKRE